MTAAHNLIPTRVSYNTYARNARQARSDYLAQLAATVFRSLRKAGLAAIGQARRHA